ncbi:MAG TPA: hypothetical protein VIF15_21205 [Polyangiaceae bacterium]|jgi:hypothetical protein
MRAFFDLVEAGMTVMRTDQLAAVASEVLEALRAAGIVRDADPGMVEISAPDLGRALRALYGAAGRGLPVPPTLDRAPAMLGWAGEGEQEREVVLVARPVFGLHAALARMRRTLVLVPTARRLTDALRKQHAPGAFVAVEALEEALAARDGRLTRAGALAPTVVASAPAAVASAPAAVEERAPRAESTAPPAAARAAMFPGAARWNQIRICIVDSTTVRVDGPGRSVRCTAIDLGMAHPRSRKPTLVWEALVEVCDGHGHFHTSRFGNADATKKLVSRLAAQLARVLGVPGSPFHRYRTGDGWRARFQARPDLPSEM